MIMHAVSSRPAGRQAFVIDYSTVALNPDDAWLHLTHLNNNPAEDSAAA
jgi:hypothetical protein